MQKLLLIDLATPFASPVCGIANLAEQWARRCCQTNVHSYDTAKRLDLTLGLRSIARSIDSRSTCMHTSMGMPLGVESCCAACALFSHASFYAGTARRVPQQLQSFVSITPCALRTEVKTTAHEIQPPTLDNPATVLKLAPTGRTHSGRRPRRRNPLLLASRVYILACKR